MRTGLFILAVAVVGCGGGVKEPDLVGTWTGKAGMTYEAMQNDASGESEQAEFLAAQEGQGKTLKLELKEDGKATFTNDQPIEGTWSLSGDALTLVLPTKQGATAPAFGGTYTFSVKGKGEMEGPDPAVKGYTLHFTK
jgi:hypothetical protein